MLILVRFYFNCCILFWACPRIYILISVFHSARGRAFRCKSSSLRSFLTCNCGLFATIAHAGLQVFLNLNIFFKEYRNRPLILFYKPVCFLNSLIAKANSTIPNTFFTMAIPPTPKSFSILFKNFKSKSNVFLEMPFFPED